jgi:hypothetical protein
MRLGGSFYRKAGVWALVFAGALFVSCLQEAGGGYETGFEVEEEIEGENVAQRIGIKINSPPDMTVYGRNMEFDGTGLAVDWLYDDDSTEAMNADEWRIVEKPDMGSYTVHKVTVKAAAEDYENDEGYEDSFWVVVMNSDKILQSISVKGPTNTVQNAGFEFDKKGLVVTGHFSDSSTSDLTSYAAIKGYDKRRRGEQNMTVKVNGQEAAFTVSTRIGDAATVRVNTPFRVGGPDDHQSGDYKEAWIKGEALSPENLNLKVDVYPGGGAGMVTLTYTTGGINASDFEAAKNAYKPAQPGKQAVSFDLDGKTFSLELFTLDVEPDVWFDYGYMRHAGDATGHGPGAGKYYAKPGETLVIAPVRYLVGYNADHSPASGTTYTWTVPSGCTYTTSNGGELLHVTPGTAGNYTISVKVSGKNYLTGANIEKTASAELVCYNSALQAGTFKSPLMNFGPGQMCEGGTGLGWSLGSAGGYEVWTVEHRSSYKIEGNAFSAWHEAGVVWLQEDRNGNGLPDETWYELRGGDDDDAAWRGKITRRYALTYIKGSETDAIINQYNQLIRPVYWADAKGRAGRIPGGFPDKYWGVQGNKVTYTATLLRDDGKIATGSYAGLVPMPGYVDALGDTFYVNKAMRADGTAVALSAVKFIKVQTGVFRYGGLFGDVSTEIQYADFLGTQSDFPKP